MQNVVYMIRKRFQEQYSSSMFCLSFVLAIIKYGILAILTFFCSQYIICGPWTNFLRNSTIIRQNKINTTGNFTLIIVWSFGFYTLTTNNLDLMQPIIWPGLSIIIMPNYKCRTKYQKFIEMASLKEFKNESQYTSMESDTFNTNPKDFILAMNMAESWARTIKNISRIPIEPPFVRTILNDYTYNGYIAVVSLEEIRKLLVKEYEISNQEKDFTFELMIFLNVSHCTMYISIFICYIN